MNFRFIIDKKYLLLKLIENKSNIQEIEEWKKRVILKILDIDIINEIEKESIEEYFVSGRFDQLLKDNDLDINKFMEDELFLKYYEETLEYLNKVQNGWLKEESKITKWLKKVIKINLLDEPIDVYISHPNLNTGKCVDQKYIFWGHYKGVSDVNYNIVYLCHENLHALLPNEECMPPAMSLYYKRDDNLSSQERWDKLNNLIDDYYKIFEFEFDIIHSIIELISDNELYTILSGKTKYNLGHNHTDYSLVKYKELIFPYWFEYLGLTLEEIEKRTSTLVNKKDIELKENDKVSIESFIKFFINNTYIRKEFKVPELVYKNIDDKKK